MKSDRLKILFGLSAVVWGEGLASSREARQFDVICSINGHIIREAHPGNENIYAGPYRPYRQTRRYVFDIGRKRYCEVRACRNFVEAFQIAPDGTIYLSRDVDGEEYVTPDRKRYRLRSILDEGRAEIAEGVCRIAKFSEFPTAKAKR